MIRRQYLQVPGPTNIPERILRCLSQPLINHRGPEFERLFTENTDGLKKVFRTKNDILMFPSSGSGMLESVVVNLFSPGDTVLVGSMGLFGERVAVIAESHKLNVIRITKEWGRAVTVDDVREILEKDRAKKIKAVCLPHNETSTGIVHDIEAIAGMMKETGHPAVLAVDAISSLACTPLETDRWGIDVVVSATQKGLMLPPGLGFVSVSPKAWELRERSTMPRWYWHAVMGTSVRNAALAMGLSLFAEKGYESDTVTAITMPEGIAYKALAEVLRERYHVIIGGGLQKLQGKIFRIGHIGALHITEVLAIMGAVELALVQCGYKARLGSAAQAAAETYLRMTPAAAG